MNGVKPKIGTGDMKLWQVQVPLDDLPRMSSVLKDPRISWTSPTIRFVLKQYCSPFRFKYCILFHFSMNDIIAWRSLEGQPSWAQGPNKYKDVRKVSVSWNDCLRILFEVVYVKQAERLKSRERSPDVDRLNGR